MRMVSVMEPFDAQVAATDFLNHVSQLTEHLPKLKRFRSKHSIVCALRDFFVQAGVTQTYK